MKTSTKIILLSMFVLASIFVGLGVSLEMKSVSSKIKANQVASVDKEIQFFENGEYMEIQH